MEFDFKVDQQDTITSFNLAGNLIGSDQAALLIDKIDSCISEKNNQIALNFQDLDYLNSSGLNMIIVIQRKVVENGGQFAICCVNKKIMDLLIITKLNTVFTVLGSIEGVKDKFNNES